MTEHDNSERPAVNLDALRKQVHAIPESLRREVWQKKQ